MEHKKTADVFYDRRKEFVKSFAKVLTSPFLECLEGYRARKLRSALDVFATDETSKKLIFDVITHCQFIDAQDYFDNLATCYQTGFGLEEAEAIDRTKEYIRNQVLSFIHESVFEGELTKSLIGELIRESPERGDYFKVYVSFGRSFLSDIGDDEKKASEVRVFSLTEPRLERKLFNKVERTGDLGFDFILTEFVSDFIDLVSGIFSCDVVYWLVDDVFDSIQFPKSNKLYHVEIPYEPRFDSDIFVENHVKHKLNAYFVF